MILMQAAGVGQQFEQSLVELLVIEVVDETRVGFADGTVKGALTIRRLVDGHERRTRHRR